MNFYQYTKQSSLNIYVLHKNCFQQKSPVIIKIKCRVHMQLNVVTHKSLVSFKNN